MNSHFLRKSVMFSAPMLGLLLAIGGLVQGQSSARKVIKKVEPQYPELLRQRGIGGTVRLKATVRADGTVRDVQIEGGNPILAESSVRAVKQWRYAPGASETTAEVVIHFSDDQQTQ